MESALLSFRKLNYPVLLLYVVLGLSSCEAKDPPATVASKPKQERRQPTTPPPPAAPKASCTLTNDTLAGQPFGAEPTVEELLRSGAKIVSRKAFANLHEAGQTDTILTLQHQGNSFEFYHSPEKDLLRQAVITNFKPAYGQRLRLTLNESARQSGGPCGQLRLRDTDHANMVSATFTAGQPSQARVQPYLD
ncbi:hypothetical protein [Hymenobacter sp. YC55]|uniref:hypothetical protein n=1 Tax=Hymenobacter sp. YC55 TaxID=3034019 RepID=UPI0023F6D0D8|nr:hypothetical protein [Hymenobacter sp. YC55]MDF7812549.1 hypothetical protein [Hymenobacter sp. YC55]